MSDSKNLRTWGIAKSFMKRSYPDYDNKKENLPEANGIYRCFPDGYFLLTDTHLNFYVGDRHSKQYSFLSTQIKDITSICANYNKYFNLACFILGLILSATGVGLLSYLGEALKVFPKILCYLSVGAGILAIIGSFTFARIRLYKINLGTLQGGITIMGSTNKVFSTSRAWNGAMTIVYDAKPNEYNLINFIEKINSRITLMQERGNYAFDDCLEDLEAYDE